MSPDYATFLERRSRVDGSGFEPIWLPDYLFDFQRALVEWAIRTGSAALFEDCGLGKTPQQLVWSENVVRHVGRSRSSGGRVLILSPLAVSAQTEREAEKFGIEASRSQDGKARRGITLTNYERLHLFDPSEFDAVVCDESGILKSFDGKYRNQITAFMKKMRHRLLCTATPAPNDYIELGTSSEALGHLGYVDMLNRFFTNKNNTGTARTRIFGKSAEWRFKGHAEEPFWRYVTSWARAVRKPSDLGFEDGAFRLPPLEEHEHVIGLLTPAEGALFAMPAEDIHEQRAERRRTVRERCEKAAALVDHDRQAIVWCHLNDEGDLLEELIPGAVQVSGSDSDEAKEERLLDFAAGRSRVLVTKPKIGAWGLNFQRCAHMVEFPSHSFEQSYQLRRRCWRFGQTQKVRVDVVATEGERGVLANMQRKAEAAERMFARLVALMNQSMTIGRAAYGGRPEEVPSWL